MTVPVAKAYLADSASAPQSACDVVTDAADAAPVVRCLCEAWRTGDRAAALEVECLRSSTNYSPESRAQRGSSPAAMASLATTSCRPPAVVTTIASRGAVWRVDDLVKALGCDSGVSKSTVSRICKLIDDDVAVLRDR